MRSEKQMKRKKKEREKEGRMGREGKKGKRKKDNIRIGFASTQLSNLFKSDDLLSAVIKLNEEGYVVGGIDVLGST